MMNASKSLHMKKTSSATLEHVNRLCYGDNLDTLRTLPSESVDLIYLDPPYNSKRVYNCSFGAKAQAKAFDDNWSWGQEQIRWLNDINERNKNVWCLLNCLMKTFKRNDGLPAYLVAMTVRLIEMHRVLKSTGSIYLHVDPTASHYLKLVMDQVFGGGRFRNEIIWCYTGPSPCKRYFPKKHDTILFYSKDEDYTFNPDAVRLPYVAEFTKARGVHGKKDYEEDDQRERYNKGKLPTSWWADGFLSNISAYRKELLGYPTQKPIALLERIIEASSNEGDVVLDPYMGSGTTIEAAAKLNRNWIGMDVTHHAVACTAARLATNLDLEEDNIPVIGVPFDLESARHLRDADRTQYDAWAILNLKAAPHEEKSGRLIGIREFKDWRESRTVDGTAIYVTSNDEPPSVTDVDRLERLMQQHKADLGFLVAFTMPDEFTLKRIQRLGEIRQNNGRYVIPKIQVITVEQIVEGGASATKIFDVSRQQRRKKILASNSQIALEV